MPKSVSITVTLPAEMAQTVTAKVASGDYESESEVIRDGLRALEARDAILERWVETEGVARYDAFHRGEQAARPLDDAFARLRAYHEERTKSPGQ